MKKITRIFSLCFLLILVAGLVLTMSACTKKTIEGVWVDSEGTEYTITKKAGHKTVYIVTWKNNTAQIALSETRGSIQDYTGEMKLSYFPKVDQINIFPNSTLTRKSK